MAWGFPEYAFACRKGLHLFAERPQEAIEAGRSVDIFRLSRSADI